MGQDARVCGLIKYSRVHARVLLPCFLTSLTCVVCLYATCISGLGDRNSRSLKSVGNDQQNLLGNAVRVSHLFTNSSKAHSSASKLARRVKSRFRQNIRPQPLFHTEIDGNASLKTEKINGYASDMIWHTNDTLQQSMFFFFSLFAPARQVLCSSDDRNATISSLSLPSHYSSLFPLPTANGGGRGGAAPTQPLPPPRFRSNSSTTVSTTR